MPRILDLFCGAGGAAVGYARAGFEVTGVDLVHQPRYPFEFHQADALTYPLDGFDAVHASPPCQAHSDLRHAWNAKPHLDLIEPIRGRLAAAGVPYVIENVEGAPLVAPIRLCGTGFGLGVGDAELWRHRLFELNWDWPTLLPPCGHRQRRRVIGVYGGHGRDRRRLASGQDYPVSSRQEAMGIDWMTGEELSQAIPPAYTEHVGSFLRDHLTAERGAA